MIDTPLSDHDKQGHVANKMRILMETRLQKLRVKNDICPIEESEQLRGRIREVKNLLNVLNIKPTFEIESDDT